MKEEHTIMESMTKEEWQAFLDAPARSAIIATVREDGRPHAATIWFAREGERIVFTSWYTSVKVKNILRDGRVSLYFMVPGSTISVRVNGMARLTADTALCTRFQRDSKHPRTVIVIRVGEVYSQCARALQRSALWSSGDLSAGLPSVGQMLQEASAGEIDGAAYDAERATRAHLGWW